MPRPRSYSRTTPYQTLLSADERYVIVPADSEAAFRKTCIRQDTFCRLRVPQVNDETAHHARP